MNVRQLQIESTEAIQTSYKGYRFRSRLEARWAVFFDKPNVKWEYEKEGYELSGGHRYLPDFWLPEMDCFFEVKGGQPTDQERLLALLLSSESKKLVAIASGTMSVEELQVGNQIYGEWPSNGFQIELFAGNAHAMWEARAHDFPMWNWIFESGLPPFIERTFPQEEVPHSDSEERRAVLVRLDQRYYLKKYDVEHPQYKWGRHEKNVSWIKCSTGGYQFALEPEDVNTQLSLAYKAAKSARFEFGE